MAGSGERREAEAGAWGSGPRRQAPAGTPPPLFFLTSFPSCWEREQGQIRAWGTGDGCSKVYLCDGDWPEGPGGGGSHGMGPRTSWQCGEGCHWLLE